MAETDDQSLEKIALQYTNENQDYLKVINMYDWVVGGDCKNRPSHSTLYWVRCRRDDPTVCSYDNGTTWQPRPEGATLSYPGEEAGCHCEAHPYRMEFRANR